VELSAVIEGPTVCLDTNILIYLLEGNDALARPLAQLKDAIEYRKARFIVSALAFSEILPPAAVRGNRAAVEQVCAFLANPKAFEIAPADTQICIQAGLLRGAFRRKIPDAIHVATALVSGCDCLLTNDDRIKTPNGLELLAISSFV